MELSRLAAMKQLPFTTPKHVTAIHHHEHSPPQPLSLLTPPHLLPLISLPSLQLAHSLLPSLQPTHSLLPSPQPSHHHRRFQDAEVHHAAITVYAKTEYATAADSTMVPNASMNTAPVTAPITVTATPAPVNAFVITHITAVTAAPSYITALANTEHATN